LQDPLLNKGTAFTLEERQALGIEGLLPVNVETLDEQLARQRGIFDGLHDDLERHTFLRQLQDHNEVLFYALLASDLPAMLPIVYTPTVGAACERFSHIYRRPRGVFIAYPERDRIAEQFACIQGDIDVIVVTDGERILGLGDQGVGGLGIPVGKLALYSGVGGIDPARTLPVVLDCGTNNQERLDDPIYLGWRNKRVSGPEYQNFVDRFVTAATARFPGVLIQWEDFAQPNAAPILDRYRNRTLSFNDDIQGTAAVALATIASALGGIGETLADQRICIVGAGSAGTGIANMIRDALAGDDCDGSPICLVDRGGLLHTDRDDLSAFQQPLAQPWERVAHWAVEGGPTDLAAVIKAVKPTVMVGVSGVGGLFTEELVRCMAAGVDRPVILPMSNPTSRAEASPADLLAWTEGRALVATGSPFAPVVFGDRTVTISQANNVYVFPGVGLGAIVSEATAVTDSMLVAAATGVADAANADGTDPDSGLLPAITKVAGVSRQVALAVAEAAVAAGVAPKRTREELTDRIANYQWQPVYRSALR